jgi:hypothetical protein
MESFEEYARSKKRVFDLGADIEGHVRVETDGFIAFEFCDRGRCRTRLFYADNGSSEAASVFRLRNCTCPIDEAFLYCVQHQKELGDDGCHVCGQLPKKKKKTTTKKTTRKSKE